MGPWKYSINDSVGLVNSPESVGTITRRMWDSSGNTAYYSIVFNGESDSFTLPEVALKYAHTEESEPEESPEPDMVDRPNHYTAGMPEGVEVIDIINAQGAGYLHGNVLKYMLRWKFKNGLEDLRKARVYLNWLIEKVEAGEDV